MGKSWTDNAQPCDSEGCVHFIPRLLSTILIIVFSAPVLTRADGTVLSSACLSEAKVTATLSSLHLFKQFIFSFYKAGIWQQKVLLDLERAKNQARKDMLLQSWARASWASSFTKYALCQRPSLVIWKVPHFRVGVGICTTRLSLSAWNSENSKPCISFF